MSCPCSKPIPGQRSLPAPGTTYPATSASSRPVHDALAEHTTLAVSKSLAYHAGSPSCRSGCPPKNTSRKCSPPKSCREIVQKYIPGWVQKLTAGAKGAMVIAKDNALCLFQPGCKGPVYYDGEEVTVEHPQFNTHQGGEESIVENGSLPLAFVDEELCVDDCGEVQKTEVIRHGIQQVREVGVGEMLGLTVDCVNGTVRQDIIEPEELDLNETGWIEGLKRLAFKTKTVENGDCQQEVKEWFQVEGFVLGPDDVDEDDTGTSYEASLIPTDLDGCEESYRLGKKRIEELDEIPEEGDYRVKIAEVTYDPECPDKVLGTKESLVPPDKVGSNLYLFNQAYEVFRESGEFNSGFSQSGDVNLSGILPADFPIECITAIEAQSNAAITSREATGTTADLSAEIGSIGAVRASAQAGSENNENEDDSNRNKAITGVTNPNAIPWSVSNNGDAKVTQGVISVKIFGVWLNTKIVNITP